ncbi:atherin-like [Pollicipes pollicipes]|uniref:atherin-like n=1 Tax=Pollicipes pollicipes TaxID=41117 RepID=UPI0018855A65|nr:atherin-like [Pollicipes pollicipes]
MYQEHYCLNGATCFKVNIGHSPLYNCECADGFMGQRCEFKDLDGSYSHLRRPGSRDAILETASIAGGAGVALLVCVLLTGLLYVWSKRRRKSQASASQLAPRFSLRQASHVVQIDRGAAPPANQQPTAGDVIELQPADRWAPSAAPPSPPEEQRTTTPVPAAGSSPGPGPPAEPQSQPCEPPPQPRSPWQRPPAGRQCELVGEQSVEGRPVS